MCPPTEVIYVDPVTWGWLMVELDRPGQVGERLAALFGRRGVDVDEVERAADRVQKLLDHDG